MLNLPHKLSGVLDIARSKLFRQQRIITVTWTLTAKCNSQCKHCGAYEEETDELNTEQSLRLIGFLAEKGVNWLLFTGGEPLVRDDIGTLVNEAKKKRMVVGINSNGLLLPKKIAEIKDIDKLQLSIDGPEEMHDAVRGKGSFKALMEAIKSARRYDIKIYLTHVLLKNNLKYVDFILNKAEELKLPIAVQPGRLKRLVSSLDNEIAPPVEEYRRTIDLLISKKREGYRWLSNSVAGLKFLRNWPEEKWLASCVAGRLHCSVDPAGFITSCSSPTSILSQGNRTGVSDNFEDSFNNLRPFRCGQCWCGNVVELNLAYNFNLDAIISCSKHFLFDIY